MDNETYRKSKIKHGRLCRPFLFYKKQPKEKPMSLTEAQINLCNKLHETVNNLEQQAKQASEKITAINWEGEKNKEHACIMHDDYTERDGIVDEHIITDPSCSYTKKFCNKFLDCDNDKCKYFNDYQEYCEIKGEAERKRMALKETPADIRLLAKFKRSFIPDKSWDDFVNQTEFILFSIGAISSFIWLFVWSLNYLDKTEKEYEKRKIEQEMKQHTTGQNTIDFYQALKLFEQAKRNTTNKQNIKIK